VLSATDFVHCVEKEEHARRKQCDEPVYYSAWQLVEPDTLPLDSVAEYMTADVVTAPPSTSIVRLAQMMLDAHLHRVVIVDNCGKPVGIVSSTDILGVVAHAENEALVRDDIGEGATPRHSFSPHHMHSPVAFPTAT
jgi:CBS-domain-containing membrane protein